MIRNLKVMGLALVAVFAMSAMAASAASASLQGEITTPTPAYGIGVDVEGEQNALTAFGSPVECPGSTYLIEEYRGSGPIQNKTTTVTATPFYNNATCNSEGLKATVNMNGCDYEFHVKNRISPGVYGVDAYLVCPANKTVIVTVFLSATNENIKACTITVPGQGPLTGGTLSNSGEQILLSGTFTGIEATESGLCGSGTTETGEYHTNVAISGETELEEEVPISLSDATE